LFTSDLQHPISTAYLIYGSAFWDTTSNIPAKANIHFTEYIISAFGAEEEAKRGTRKQRIPRIATSYLLVS
jgi:hypothetical protein